MSVRADSVSFAYERGRPKAALPALEGITLDVRRGTFISILGPSGCGKTTLIKLIDGLLEPTRGSIEVNGTGVRGPGPDRAMVFQHPSLLPWRTVEGNVSYGLELNGVHGVLLDSKVAEAIDLVGLGDFKDYYPHALSGGMQQKVNIARAAALNPEILLMDEPFGSLDAQTREELQLEFLAIFRKAKSTVVFVTHDIGEAVLMSDMVAVLTPRPGKIKKLIEIDIERPRTANVRNMPAFARLCQVLWDLLHSREQEI